MELALTPEFLTATKPKTGVAYPGFFLGEAKVILEKLGLFTVIPYKGDVSVERPRRKNEKTRSPLGKNLDSYSHGRIHEFESTLLLRYSVPITKFVCEAPVEKAQS